MRSIGIDIGRFSIKVAVVRHSGGRYRLEDFFESPFSTDITHDPYIHTMEVLRKLSASFDPGSTKFCLALPQSSVCTRFKVFPFKERYKVVKSIAFELEDDIPFDQDEAVFDAKVLRINQNSSEVLAVASPHDHIRQLLRLCEEAGIDPDIISMEASAVANLVEDWSSAPGERSDSSLDAGSELSGDSDDEDEVFQERQNMGGLKLLLHIGHTKTLITAYSDSQLVATHSISFGGRDVVKAISETYSLSYPEALKTFREKGFILTNKKTASKDQVFFSDCISGSLKSIVGETKRFLLSLHADFDFELASLHLSGGVSQLINIGAFFTQAFEVAVNPHDHSLKHGNPSFENDDSYKFRGGLSIGLAIEGIKLARNPAINFRQGELAKQSQSWDYMYERWGSLIRVGAVLTASIFIYAPLKSYFAGNLLSKAKSNLSAETKKQGLRGRTARGTGLNRYIKAEQRKVKSMAQLHELEKMSSAIDVLAKISSSVPGRDKIDLDLRKVELKNADLKLEGYVLNQNQMKLMDQVVRNLSTGTFEKTRPSIKTVNGKLAFGYSLQVDRMESM